jgi:hypothetical protein
MRNGLAQYSPRPFTPNGSSVMKKLFPCLMLVALMTVLAHAPSAFAGGWIPEGKAPVQCWGSLPPLTEHTRYCGDIQVAQYRFETGPYGSPKAYQRVGAFIKEGYTGPGANDPSAGSVNGTWPGYQNHCKSLYSNCCSQAAGGNCWLWYDYKYEKYSGERKTYAWPNTSWRPPGH